MVEISGSYIVIQDRSDYLIEAQKQLRDKKFYQEVNDSENKLSILAEMSNQMFSSLKKRGYITQKQLNFFSYEYRKATNFGELYFLHKIHKRLHSVPGKSGISNCGTPTEKCWEFLDCNLKPLMQ